MGWINHVRDAIYDALCAVFGTDPASADSLKRFVPAYIQDATNTQAPRDTNICYFAVSESQESGFNYVQTSGIMIKGAPAYKTCVTVPVDVLFTFYGPDADDDAETFWARIQQDIDCTSARAVLRSKRIVPMEGPSRPQSVFEIEGTYHRRRCDVRMGFAYLMITDSTGGYVDSPPEIGVVSQ